MELRVGYKQTEVGVIPEDWEISQLAKFTSFVSYGFTNPMPTSESGIYMITAKDINQGRIQFDSARCTTEEAYRTRLTSKSRPKKGDLLLTKDGTLGRLALVDDRTVCINQSVAVIRPNHKVSSRFLKVLLEAARYQNQMLEDAGGSTIKHIYITIVDRMLVAVPPTKGEQESIGEALRNADAFIESLEQLLAKKRQIKQGAMQELLSGKRRLPGFQFKSGFKQNELAMIPEDWEVKPMSELFTFQNGINAEKSAYGHGIQFINVLEVITHPTITEASIPGRVELSAQIVNAFSVRRGDVLFNRTSETQEELGLASVYSGVAVVVFGGFVIRARPRENHIDSSFARYSLRSPVVRAQIVAKGQGAVRANIGQGELSRIQVVLPAIAEQEAIGDTLNDMDAEIAALEARLAKARAIKQGMMQELLTGRIRLV